MKARLPEERKVNIQMLSFNDGERLITALKGRIAPAGEGFLLRYADPQMDGVETALRYDGTRLHLSRNDGTRLTFEKDVPTAGVYCLPYGNFEAEVKTSALTCKKSEKRAEIALCYTLNMGGQDFSCKMKISAEEEE